MQWPFTGSNGSVHQKITMYLNFCQLIFPLVGSSVSPDHALLNTTDTIATNTHTHIHTHCVESILIRYKIDSFIWVLLVYEFYLFTFIVGQKSHWDKIHDGGDTMLCFRNRQGTYIFLWDRCLTKKQTRLVNLWRQSGDTQW